MNKTIASALTASAGMICLLSTSCASLDPATKQALSRTAANAAADALQKQCEQIRAETKRGACLKAVSIARQQCLSEAD